MVSVVMVEVLDLLVFHGCSSGVVYTDGFTAICESSPVVLGAVGCCGR